MYASSLHLWLEAEKASDVLGQDQLFSNPSSSMSKSLYRSMYKKDILADG